MGPSSSWCFDSGLISINQFGHSDRGSWLNCCFTALQHLRSLAQGCGGEIIRCRQFRVISRTNEDPRDSRALLTCPCTPLHFFAVFMNCSIPNMCTKVIWSALVYHSYLEYIYIYIYWSWYLQPVLRRQPRHWNSLCCWMAAKRELLLFCRRISCF